MIRRAHAQHVERSLTNRFSFAGVRQLVVNTFCGRFKFAYRSLCQASMITFVGFFSECLRIRDFSYFCNSLRQRAVNSLKCKGALIDLSDL